MLQLNLKPETEQKFLSLIKSYKNEEIFVEKLIEHQIAELNRGILNIELDLQRFEKKYNLSTKAFYKKWQSGNMGDSNEDFFIWSGIYEGLQRKYQKLENLQ